MPLANPVPGRVYTAKQVLTELHLPDLPFFMVRGHNNEWNPIQTSCVSDEKALLVPGFAESLWKFVRITKEWIPVFHYVKAGLPPEAFCTIEDDVEGRRGHSWVCLVGFHRDQHK